MFACTLQGVDDRKGSKLLQVVTEVLHIMRDGAAGTVANESPQEGRLYTAQELRGLASVLLRLLLDVFGVPPPSPDML